MIFLSDWDFNRIRKGSMRFLHAGFLLVTVHHLYASHTAATPYSFPGVSIATPYVDSIAITQTLPEPLSSRTPSQSLSRFLDLQNLSRQDRDKIAFCSGVGIYSTCASALTMCVTAGKTSKTALLTMKVAGGSFGCCCLVCAVPMVLLDWQNLER
jgi:hypothetical protein